MRMLRGDILGEATGLKSLVKQGQSWNPGVEGATIPAFLSSVESSIGHSLPGKSRDPRDHTH